LDELQQQRRDGVDGVAVSQADRLAMHID
jgi:hypothetical protein